MEPFMVERYLPGVTAEGFDHVRARLIEAAGATPGVRYLGSTFIPEEESCFCRFEGVSLAAVERACEAAGVPFARIHAACDFSA